ncbi:hypothetical protein MTO96_026927 [Rhipicephalus appendiculatus]
MNPGSAVPVAQSVGNAIGTIQSVASRNRPQYQPQYQQPPYPDNSQNNQVVQQDVQQQVQQEAPQQTQQEAPQQVQQEAPQQVEQEVQTQAQPDGGTVSEASS